MYAIKKTYEATEKNTNFAGNKQIWLAGELVFDNAEVKSLRVFDVDYVIRAKKWEIEQGWKSSLYKTRNGMVMKSEKRLAESEMEYGMWKITVEWVEV